MSDPMRHISKPSELALLQNDASSPTSSTSTPPPPPQTITLHLLGPLSSPWPLAQCLAKANGPFQSEHKLLNLSPLTKRWRAAWAAVPATAVDRVVFNLAPPEPTAKSQKVHWATKIPGDKGIGVVEMDAIRLVMTMATTMSMRSRKTVVFEVAGDVHPDGPTRDDFKELKKIVAGLSKAPEGVVA